MRRGLHTRLPKGPYHEVMKDLPARIIKRNPLMETSQRFFRVLLCLSFCMPVSIILASTLDPQARQQAQLVANSTDWIQSGLQPKAGHKNPHPLGVQTLSIEIQESKGNLQPSVLRVYQYHYDLLQARLLRVDVFNSQVLKSQLVNSVHLPLNQAEIDHATMLLQKHNAIIQQLRDEQISRGNVSFNSITDLDVKASIYEPHDPTHPCAKQRCALLSLFDDTRTVFSVEPVINLQVQHVGLLNNP